MYYIDLILTFIINLNWQNRMVRVIEGYVLNEVIGEGNFGLVYKATHKDKAGIYAVKVIPNEKFQQNQRLQIYQNNEIQALQAIGISQYIIRFYEIIKSKNNCYLVYQFCNGGTLQNILKREQRLDEKKALIIFRQLLEAFKVLNKNNIMHRDLKPQNIFFTSQNQDEAGQVRENDKKKVKLGDFGFCKGLKPEQNLAKTMLGSPIYMAPEVLKGQSYTTKADIWSLGVILFQMLYGYCPYESKSIASLINTIDTQPVQLPGMIPVSERTQSLVKRMLTKDYFRRIGWVELFNTRIDQNGQYIDQPVVNLSASQDNRGSTPNKKVFSSLFAGSLTSLGVSTQLPTNNRSYSTMRQQQKSNQNNNNQNNQNQPQSQIQNQNQNQNSQNIGNQIRQQARFDKRIKQQNNPQVIGQARVNSQPKDQKRFYSQNYINILSTPLSLKKVQNQGNISNADKSKQKPKIVTNNSTYDKEKALQKSPAAVVSPLNFRQERITSMDNIDVSKQQTAQLGNLVGSNNVQPIPFNKYRENIGLGSRLSSQFLSDRIIKEPVRHSNSQYTPSNVSNGDQLSIKRSNLLKIHESITKTLTKGMSLVEQRFIIYKTSKQLSDFCLLKDLLQDCYVVLKIVQEKLKSITQSIKITETSLLDMASIVNYEHIQVQKFVIQIRNQLMRCSVELPNMPSGLQLSKVDRMQNANNFKELIKNKFMMQVVDDCF